MCFENISDGVAAGQGVGFVAFLSRRSKGDILSSSRLAIRPAAIPYPTYFHNAL